MTGINELCDACDAFLAAPKRIAGVDRAGHWVPGRLKNELEMRYPLEVAGELGGAQLMVIGFPRERGLKFRLGILCPAMICRIDFTDETHGNSLFGIADGLPPAVQGPHYHSWPINRRFFRGVTKAPELHDAVPFEGRGHRSFDAVLRWFCADTNIEPPPNDHAIALPPQELV